MKKFPLGVQCSLNNLCEIRFFVSSLLRSGFAYSFILAVKMTSSKIFDILSRNSSTKGRFETWMVCVLLSKVMVKRMSSWE